MRDEPQVVVVGAGPAGLAAAIALARHDIPTLVVEQRTVPLDKACGEGLLDSAVRGLAALGLSPGALEARGARLAGIRYFSPRGRRAEARFEHGALSVGLRRSQLSELLLERAAELPLLELRCDSAARVTSEAGRPCVSVGSERWRPRLLIGADGLNSGVRRALGIATRFGPRRRYGVRRHFDVAAWSDHVEVYFARGLEAYVTPLGDGVNIAFLWTPQLQTRAGAPAPFDELLARFPELEQRIAGATPQDRARGAGPFDQHPVERVRAGLALVGDAGGYIDALTGEGVGLAVTQALALERAVVPFLRSRSSALVPSALLERFLRDADARTAANRLLTRVLLALIDQPWTLEPALALLGASEGLFRHLLGANSGRRELWRLPSSA
jgi:2-polyprenyl-6-methoxyphenol hydroxylase-like FAD-dependent oxidoreductase